MAVIIHAQDLSGRMDDGHYTMPNISAALDIFFDRTDAQNFFDDNAEDAFSREDAEEILSQDKRVSFFNADGEKVEISLDSATTA